jgi:hypothetical protein
VHRFRGISRRDAHTRRDVLILIAIWGIGALLLVAVVTFSGQVDRASKGQIVAATLQEQLGGTPTIAINVTPATRAAVARRLALSETALQLAAVALPQSGAQQFRTKVAAAIPGYFTTFRLVASLVESQQLGRALSVTKGAFLPGGSGLSLLTELNRAGATEPTENAHSGAQASPPSC